MEIVQEGMYDGWRTIEGAVLQDNYYGGNVTRLGLILTKAGEFLVAPSTRTTPRSIASSSLSRVLQRLLIVML
jgi:hypothetical protein